MKIKELQAKVDELKQITEPSEEQKTELSSFEAQLQTETQSFKRYGELSEKDENLLTTEEVDEFLQLGEKFADEKPEPSAQQGAGKKYAGKYATPEELIDGLMSSEQERKRITEEMAKDPELATAMEEAYKGSQRTVTKLVSVKKPPVRVDTSRKPLAERELEEMTFAEYDAWEKSNKLEAHVWLTSATAKSVQVNTSKRNVFKKYPNWLAEIQGIAEYSKELLEWDKLDKENAVDKSLPDWPEKIMVKMEENLGIKQPLKKPAIILKPGFEQGKGGGVGKSESKKLTVAEFEALSDDERTAYLESQKPKTDR